MTTPPTPEQLRAAVETAQSVTEGVGDPQLRGIAFGKILERLLAGEPLPTPTHHAATIPPSTPPQQVVSGPIRNGPNAWIDSLVAEGFFAKSRSLADVTEAVRAQGHNVESKNVTAPLEKLLQLKVIRRERKASETAQRGVWMYSNY